MIDPRIAIMGIGIVVIPFVFPELTLPGGLNPKIVFPIIGITMIGISYLIEQFTKPKGGEDMMTNEKEEGGSFLRDLFKYEEEEEEENEENEEEDEENEENEEEDEEEETVIYYENYAILYGADFDSGKEELQKIKELEDKGYKILCVDEHDIIFKK